MSEEVTFYIPGAERWGGALNGILRSRRIAHRSDEIYLVEYDDNEQLDEY